MLKVIYLSIIASVITGVCVGQTNFTDHTFNLANPNVNTGLALAVSDLNSDGLDDIIRVQQNILYVDYQLGNGLWSGTTQNLSGYEPWSLCVADIDKNGYQDIFIGYRYDTLEVFMNDSTGEKLSPVTLANSNNIFSQASNFVDINNDGHTDLFVCDDDEIAKAYKNDGSGNLILDNSLINAVSAYPSDNSGNYGSVWTDYDNDGDIDMYLSRCRAGATNPLDGRRVNQLFQNDGSGNYTDVGESVGMVPYLQSWSTDFADIDLDGDLDALVLNHGGLSYLYINNGDGTFIPDSINAITQTLSDSLYTFEGIFEDLDNNGFEDYINTNYKGTSYIFWNDSGVFTPDTLNLYATTVPAKGFAQGDLNNDGFIDLIVSYSEGFFTLSTQPDKMLINSGNSNNFLKVKLQGTSSNINGIGARLELYGDWGKQIREIRSGESYAISNSLTAHFGIAAHSEIDSLIVRWPSGQVSKICSPKPNQTLSIIENDDSFSGLSINLANLQSHIELTSTEFLAPKNEYWIINGTDSGFTNPFSYPLTGPDTLEICKINNYGCTELDSLCKTYHLDTAGVNSFFTYSDSLTTIAFSDSSTSSVPINEWFWDFGNGFTSTDTNPVFQFTQPDTQFVCLTVTNAAYVQNTFCDSIIFTCSRPVSDFTFQLDGKILDLEDATEYNMIVDSSNYFDLGTGIKYLGPSLSRTLPDTGLYQICNVASSGCGTDTICKSINVQCNRPKANFGLEVNGRTVEISDSSITDTLELSYNWQFGDGNLSNNALVNSHTYIITNVYYEFCLTVANSCGSDTKCEFIFPCIRPTLDFKINADGFTFTFDSVVALPTAFVSWDLGDGTFKAGDRLEYTYGDTGQYTVCVQIDDPCGSDTLCKQISVKPTSVAEDIEYSKLNIMVYNHRLELSGSEQLIQGNVNIYNSLGQKIKSQVLTQAKINVDITTFKAGIYIITVEKDGFLARKRVIIH